MSGFNRFPSFDPFNDAVRQREIAQSREQSLAMQRQQEARRGAADLAEAQERMRQHCRNAASYILSRGISTERATARVPVDGGGGWIGHRPAATKFMSITFPEGWVIGKFSNGGASDVLTPVGLWMTATSVARGAEKEWYVTEKNFDNCKHYIPTSEGPRLIYNSGGIYEDGEAPSLIEDDLTQRIARLVVG